MTRVSNAVKKQCKFNERSRVVKEARWATAIKELTTRVPGYLITVSLEGVSAYAARTRLFVAARKAGIKIATAKGLKDDIQIWKKSLMREGVI